MKWTQVFCLLAIAASGVVSAGEFDAPSAPSLPGGPAPIFDNDSFQGAQEFAVPHGDIAPSDHAAQIQPGPQGAAPCLNCNGGMRQCCEHETSCCDNVWDNYCAEKIDWCQRGRRPFFRAMTDCFPEDGCRSCNCRRCTFGANSGGLQARLKRLRGGDGCAACGNAGCAGGCAAATHSCAAKTHGCAAKRTDAPVRRTLSRPRRERPITTCRSRRLRICICLSRRRRPSRLARPHRLTSARRPRRQ